MATSLKPSAFPPDEARVDTAWSERYSQLTKLAWSLVRTYRVSAWRGQEYDIVEDIVQETVRRMIERTRKAECGEAAPVESLERMMTTIAYNYCRDLRRREWRLVRNTASGDLGETGSVIADSQESFADVAVENVYCEELFTLIAHEVARFPAKQRHALLVDLASEMQFGPQPTALQAAFLAAGVRLEEYRQNRPEDPKERGKRISLRNHAYKRIARHPRVRAYAFERPAPTSKTT